jgi:hypothetical protein
MAENLSRSLKLKCLSLERFPRPLQDSGNLGSKTWPSPGKSHYRTGGFGRPPRPVGTSSQEESDKKRGYRGATSIWLSGTVVGSPEEIGTVREAFAPRGVQPASSAHA